MRCIKSQVSIYFVSIFLFNQVDLAALQKEEAQLRKLVNIARPASLPELVAPVAVSESAASKDTDALKNKLMLAARKKAIQKQQVYDPRGTQGSATKSLNEYYCRY